MPTLAHTLPTSMEETYRLYTLGAYATTIGAMAGTLLSICWAVGVVMSIAVESASPLALLIPVACVPVFLAVASVADEKRTRFARLAELYDPDHPRIVAMH